MGLKILKILNIALGSTDSIFRVSENALWNGIVDIIPFRRSYLANNNKRWELDLYLWKF